MPETEIWLTRLFNDHLASLGNWFLGLARMAPQPRPWANYITMELLVAAILVVVTLMLRARLSHDRPGKLQHTFELLYEFLNDQARDQVGHHSNRYLAFFGTIFFFILLSNLISLVPGFEAPTMNAAVTLGCAMATFLYYNMVGIQAHGVLKYLAHFAGPLWWLAPLMFPVEIIGHLARPLSLTIRLYGNMYAGEQVTLVFIKVTKLVVPVAFMGLHLFVAVVQAYIFLLLTMMYVGTAVVHEEH